MPRKKYAPEEIVAKLRQVDLASQGQNIAYAIRQIGVERGHLLSVAARVPGTQDRTCQAPK